MSYVISVVGAGGKSAYIERLAEKFARENHRVCITTTTHIYRQPNRENISYVGADSDGGKLSYPGDKVFQELRKIFDVVLVEADGSRHMPVKIPAPYEPVIPACSDEIVIVMGHHAVGRSVGEVCQRFDSVDISKLEARFPAINGATIIDTQIIDFIAEEYYAKSLRSEFPSANVKYIRNNIFDGLEAQRGKKIALVIMASGMGRRFSRYENKLLYKIRGKEIVRYGLDNMIDAQRLLADFGIKSEVFAVTADDGLTKFLTGIYSDGINIIHNPDSAEGIAASVRRGAEAALTGNFDALILMAGDMPNLGSGDILRLSLEFLCSGKIYGCAYSSHPSNPGIFLRECYDDLLTLSGDSGAMRLIKSAPYKTHYYPVRPEKLFDVDTVQDITSIMTSTFPPQIIPSSAAFLSDRSS